MLDEEIEIDQDTPAARLVAWSLSADDRRSMRMTLRFEGAEASVDERANSVSVLLPAEAALHLAAELERQALAIEAQAERRREGSERKRLI